jgi:hypothetical protein
MQIESVELKAAQHLSLEMAISSGGGVSFFQPHERRLWLRGKGDNWEMQLKGHSIRNL